MKVKIRASMLTKWHIWKVYDAENNKLIDWWFRSFNKNEGITKEQLEKILIKKGYQLE